MRPRQIIVYFNKGITFTIALTK